MAKFLKGTKNIMGGALDATKNLAKSTVEGAKNVAGGAMDGVKNVGGGVAGGLTSGIKNVTGGVTGGLKNVAGGVVGIGGAVGGMFGIGGKDGDDSDDDGAIRRRASSMLAKARAKDDIATRIQLFRDINQPCDVYSWLEITIQDIDLVNQQFDCSIEVHIFWQDYALPNVFPNYEEDAFEIDNDCLPLKMTEIFENQISCEITSDPSFDYFDDTSCVYMMFVVECKFVERMELQRFPLDRQFLTMQLNAYTGKSATGNWNWILTKGLDWVPIKWRNRSYYVRMVASISSEYNLETPWIDFNTNDETIDIVPMKGQNSFQKARSDGNQRRRSQYGNDNNSSNIETGNDGEIADYAYDGPIISEPNPLSIALRVERNPGFYYGNILFPNFLIGLGCAGAFVVPPEELADRLGVLITLMLAAVAFRFVVSTMLPRISYLTLMDKYLLFSFIMIIVLICENAIVAIDEILDDKNWIQAFDYTFLLGFYIGWGVIHLFFGATMVFPGFYRIGWKDMYDIDGDDSDDNEEVFGDDYQFVKSNNETQSCIDKWQQIQEEKDKEE